MLTNGATVHGSVYSGAVSYVLWINDVAPADEVSPDYGFYCVISNECGTITSSKVGLTVIPSPLGGGCRNVETNAVTNSYFAVVQTEDIYGGTNNPTCGSITLYPGTVFPMGTNFATLTVADWRGVTSVCTAMVTVVDAQRPVIGCLPDLTILAAQATGSVNGAVLGWPQMSDNYGILSVTNVPTQLQTGTNSVAWTVTDLSGNFSVCTQNVIVVGSQPASQSPFLICPPTVVVTADPGTNVASNVNLGQATMIGCDSPTITSNPPSSFALGTNWVTWIGTCGPSYASTNSQLVFVMPNASLCTNVPAIATNGVLFINVVSNQSYAYQASGCVWWNTPGGPTADPDGNLHYSNCTTPWWPPKETNTGSSYTCPGMTGYSLVGKLNGSCLQLGTGGVFTASSSGQLVLYFNDQTNYFWDNSGSFSVCISQLGSSAGPSGITLLSPTNNQTVAANLNIILVADAYSATGSITKVQFFDGTNNIAQTTNPPYYYVWLGTNVTVGSHLLSATASNSLGYCYTSNVATVQIASAASVNITNPINGAVFAEHSNIQIEASVSPTGGISCVQFFENHTSLGQDSSAPYGLIWTNVSSGRYGLLAKAYDASGKTGVSSAITITVNASPEVTLLSPASNIVAQSGAPFTLLAAARDTDGWISNVTFYTDGSLQGSVSNSPYALSWTIPTNAYATVYAMAKDNLGATAVSDTKTITINHAPVVNLTSPTGVVFQVGESITFQADASDSDSGDSITEVAFYQGSTLLASYTSAPYQFIWQNASPGSYVLTAKATDARGGSTTTASHSLRVNAPATVTLTSPTQGGVYPQGSSIGIDASVADTDGAVTNVIFLLDTSPIQSVFGSWSSGVVSITNAFSAGSYALRAVATDNDRRSTTSTPVNIVVSAPVSVSIYPTSLTICSGLTTNFSTTVSGTGPYDYVWKHNGNLLSGQTNDFLPLANVSTSDAGTYTVEVTGPYSSDTNSATLTVPVNVSATELTNVTVCVGSTATFSTEASGTGPITYSWWQNGDLLDADGGNTLVLDGVSLWDNGTITVIVSGACGTATKSATLTVGDTPAATDQSLTTDRNTDLSITLSGIDPDNHSLTYQVVSGPSHGTLNSNNIQNPVYTPNDNYVGTDTFTFRVNNATCDSPPATVTIDVLDDHWVMFFNMVGSTSIDQTNLNLMITSPFSTTGAISYVVAGLVSTQVFSVTPGAVTNLAIPLSVMATNYDIAGTNAIHGIHITSRHPVSVYGMNYRAEASEAFAGYPTSMLGTNYCLIARQSGALVYDDNCPWCDPDVPLTRSQFAVLATENDTVITIFPSSSANLVGHSETNSFDISLDRGQTYLFESSTYTNDVTGTLIKSTKPIGVFAGARSGALLGSDLSFNHNPLVEELFPVESWGRQVLAFPLPSVSEACSGVVYRVVAADSTLVTTNGSFLANLGKGGFCEVTNTVLEGPVEFRGDNPIQVAQFSIAVQFDDIVGLGDPFEMLVPPTSHFTDTYTIATPTGFVTNFLNLVVERVAIPTTLLDGQSLPAYRYKQIGNTGYSGIQVAVAPGPHTVTSSRPLSAQVYGFGSADGYGYVGHNGGVSNKAIVAVSDGFNAPSNTATEVDVLANDLFANPTSVNVSILSYPTHGTAVVNAAKNVVYTSTLDYHGDDQFTYKITESGQESTAPVTIWVDNHSPTVTNSAVGACWGTPTVIPVLEYASDPDGDSLSFLSVGNSSYGDVQVNPDNTITYYCVYSGPSQWYQYPQSDSFTYTVTDGKGGTVSATVSITVRSSLAYNITDTVCGEHPKSIFPVPNVLPIRYVSYVSQPLHGDVEVIGLTNIIYRPGPGFVAAGSDHFTYTLTDTNNYCTSPLRTITVTNVPGSPCTNLVLNGDSNCQSLVPDLTHGCGGVTLTQVPPMNTLIAYGETNVVVTEIGTSNCCTARVVVVCTNGTPVAEITSPAPVTSTPPVVHYPVVSDGFLVVTGSAYRSGAASSNVEYRVQIKTPDGLPVQDSGWFPPAVILNGLINTNDLTSLSDGLYDLVLTAGTKSGPNADHVVRFVLNSPLKIGQFSFSQQDMVIPVSGIPITVTRTYNSLNPDAGDFGYGWTYALNDLNVQIDEERQDYSYYNTSGSESIRIGGSRDVTLTLPDGRRATFAFQQNLALGCGSGGCYFHWVAPPGVAATLTHTGPAYAHLRPPASCDSTFSCWDGQQGGTFTAQHNENSFDFPGFVLTMPDGTRYEIEREDLASGSNYFFSDDGQPFTARPYGPPKLSKILLRDGTYLTNTADGVEHSSGKGILFTRDGADRITAIYDPESLDANGNTNGPPALKYMYDSQSNLATVSNLVVRVDPPVYRATVYMYELTNSHPHYITGIKDPRGVQPLKNLYDGGKLIGVLDAFGKTNSFNHDVAHRKETITDRMGNQTIHVYDERGNVLTTTDSSGTVTRSYDANNNLLTVTDQSDNTTKYSYDGHGNRTNVIDALSRTNKFTYDSYANLLTHTDPLGNVTVNLYDSTGNLTNTTVQDAQTHVVSASSSTYTNGNLTETHDALGRMTGSFGYDGSGNLTSATDANGLIRNFNYDDNGNQTTNSYIWVNPLNTNQSVVVTTTTIYDGSGRVTRTIDADGQPNITVYNPIGKVASTTNKLGLATSYTYDAQGNLIQTVYPDLTVTRTVYDDNGRAVISTDRAYVGQASPPVSVTFLRATRTYYDAVGRVTNTVRLANLRIDLTTVNTQPSSVFVSSAEDPLSTSSTEYYDNGWVKSRTGPDNQTTHYEYYGDGQLKWVIDPLGHTNTFVYDDAGRREQVTDALQHATQFTYDPVGRLIKTIYDDTTFTSNTFNEVGQRIGETDQAGLTTDYDYYVSGPIKSVKKPQVRDAEGSTSAQPTWQYVYDTYGRLFVTTDPKGRTTTNTYDAVGRQLTRTLPMGQSETNVYNSLGQLVTRTNFNGNVEKLSYDYLGRIESREFYTNNAALLAKRICISYDDLGRQKKIVELTGNGLTNSCNTVLAFLDGAFFGSLLSGTGVSPVYLGRSVAQLSGTGILPVCFGLLFAVLLCLGLLICKKAQEFLRPFAVFLRHPILSVCHPELVEGSLSFGRRLYIARLRVLRAYYPVPSYLRVLSLILIPVLFFSFLNPGPEVLAAACPCQGQNDDSVRVTEFTYDNDGHVTQICSPEGTVNYEYELATGRHARTYTGNSDTEYRYDPLGRLWKVIVHKRNGVVVSETTTYQYTGVGSRESIELPNGTKATYEYDNLNRLTKLSNLSISGSTTNLLSSFDYLLHATGRRTNVTEAILQPDDSSFITNTIDWRYDGMYRLTNEVYSSTDGTSFSTSYAYDLVGNRKTKNTTTYVYNSNDQLLSETNDTAATTYLYDANGSLTNKTSATETYNYAYNAQNQLSSVTVGGATTSYVYNHQGIRVRSATGSETNYFLVDPNNHTGYAQVLEELSTVGGAPTMSYVIGDDVISQSSGVGSPSSYLLYDAHGSTRQLSQSLNTVVRQYNYDAYGVGINLPSLPLTSLLYAGEQWDSVLKQYYLRARYYDPSNGRFNQLDTFAGNNFDPQSLHKYAYAQDDPVNGMDPSGANTITEIGCAVFILTYLYVLVGTSFVNQPARPWDHSWIQPNKNFLEMLNEKMAIQKEAQTLRSSQSGFSSNNQCAEQAKAMVDALQTKFKEPDKTLRYWRVVDWPLQGRRVKFNGWPNPQQLYTLMHHVVLIVPQNGREKLMDKFVLDPMEGPRLWNWHEWMPSYWDQSVQVWSDAEVESYDYPLWIQFYKYSKNDQPLTEDNWNTSLDDGS